MLFWIFGKLKSATALLLILFFQNDFRLYDKCTTWIHEHSLHNVEHSNLNSDVTNDNDKIGHHKHFFVKIMKIDIEQYDVLNWLYTYMFESLFILFTLWDLPIFPQVIIKKVW